MDMNLKKLKEDHPSLMNEQEFLGPNESEVEDEMTKKKNKAMEKVFQIPSVVQQIIEGLQHLSDLKACRRVSSMWMETTSKVITKKDSCRVFIIYDNYLEKFQRFFKALSKHYVYPMSQEYSKYSDVANHLPALTQLIRKSTYFPCTTFRIEHGDLTKSEMVEFLKVAGGYLKTLKLLYTSTPWFDGILNVYCPNLEKLIVKDCDITTINSPCQVPNLKILSIHHDIDPDWSPFNILQCVSFPNLQMIDKFCLSRDLEQVMNAGKIHCVKKLDFMIGPSIEELDKFQTFVESGPQLENVELWLCDDFMNMNSGEKRKWLRLIQKLLNLSQHTLKFLRFIGIETVHRDLHFPTFSRLVEIKIDNWRTTSLVGTDERYPYEILDTRISPNLKVIKGFHLSRDTEAVVGIGRIGCVKDLTLWVTVLEDMSKFKMFLEAGPQLDTLHLRLSETKEISLKRKREWTGLLEQLLDLSKDTLHTLHFDGVGVVFEDMKFPIFSSLEQIRIVGDSQRIFPRGINLTETFPKLETLNVRDYTKCDDDKKWNLYLFPGVAFAGSLSSAKLVVTSIKISPTFKNNLLDLCPNAHFLKY